MGGADSRVRGLRILGFRARLRRDLGLGRSGNWAGQAPRLWSKSSSGRGSGSSG